MFGLIIMVMIYAGAPLLEEHWPGPARTRDLIGRVAFARP